MKFAKDLAIVANAITFLLLCATSQIVSAGQIHNASILQQNAMNEGSFSLRMTLALGNTRQNVLLNESQTFSNLKIVSAGNPASPSLHPLAAESIKSYQGQIENLPNSWVRLTVAGNYLSGTIDTGTHRTFITSEPELSPPLNHRQIKEVVHAADKAIMPPPEKRPDRIRQTRDVIQINVAGAVNQDRVTRVARIAIVVDTLYDEALGGRGLANAISTINTVDGMYQQEFGLALKVDTAIIITDTETLDLGGVSLEENLAKFRDYRQAAAELDADLGLVHLFTGAPTTDPSVGLAYIGAVCRLDGYDVSMSTPFDFPVLLTAHEIGHNLGALHDDETELCKLTTEQLMFSHISSLTTNEFSSCTIDAINKRLDQSACHLDAIDLSLTLTRSGDSSVLALITNTDSNRAFNQALFKLNLENASVASTPAICDTITTDNTEILCSIPTTYPGESLSLEFDLRFSETEDNILDSSLEAVGFIDNKTINNHAQLVVAAQPLDQPTTIAGNDNTDTTTGSADPTPVTVASGGNAGSGGGTTGLFDLIVLLSILLTGMFLPRRHNASSLKASLCR